MPLIANLSQDEMALIECLRHPVLCSEFIKDLDLSDDDEPWKYEIYQEEILCDFSTYVSLRAARSVGKTEVLIFGRTIWYLVNNFYPDPLLFTAPNKVHLQVPFDKLTKFIKSNKLLQNYVERSGINNSDYIIRSKNGFQFIGRIAGKSGSGINIIGLHIPFIIIDESGYYPYGTFLELMPTFNTFQDGCQMIIAGTPDGRRDRSVNYYADEIDPEFSKHRVSAYENPRFSEEDEKQAIIRYGGKESEDFAHYVLGEHGNPVFSMFSRENMLIEQYPIFTAKYKGKDFMGDPHFINQILSSMPPLPNFYEQVIFGVDLGYVEPTEIHILYQTKGRWYFHSRIELGQVDYPLQEKLLDLLDSKFNPSLIGIDEGGVGKNFVQHLLLDDAYINKTYANRLLPIKFGGTVVIGLDENGEEIKVKTKQVGMQRLQSATNNKEICYSSQDEELISELERTTYSKTAAGEIQYFTESSDGSNRNDDHNIAALMCAILAWYTKNEVSLFQPIEKKLLNKFQWWTT